MTIFGDESTARAAREYASRGLAVFPVWAVLDGGKRCACGDLACDRKGKHPVSRLVRNGKLDATNHISRIESWWRQAANHNIGIACAPSNIVAVDVDPRNGGVETFEALVRELGELPRTPTVDTGGGGFHIYLRAPSGVQLEYALGHGVELISNGYVIGAPSRHESGRSYRWRDGLALDEVELAELPPAWLTRCLRASVESVPYQPRATKFGTGDDIYEDCINKLDQGAILEMLSGTWLVNGETIQVGKPNSRGNRPLIIDGKERGGYIDGDAKIAHKATAGRKDGGPFAWTWLRYYGHDDKQIVKGLLELVPEVARFAEERRERRSKTTRREPPPGFDPGAADPISPHDFVDATPPGGDDVPPPGDDDAPGGSDLPEIFITTDQRGVVNAAEDALVRAGRCSDVDRVYVRARALVGVIYEQGDRESWLRRPKGTPVVTLLQKERVRELCGAAANWKRARKGKGGEIVIDKVMVPPWVAATLRERNQWVLPPIDGVSDVPVLRDDGSVHDTPGYDERTRVLFDSCGAHFPRGPRSPTQSDAQAAMQELLEPFTDFCFVGDSDRAAVVALILTIIARSTIAGCVPMFVASAPTPGSGKGLVIDACAVIATGRMSPKMAPTENDEEMRKRLLTIGLEALSLVTIDNVEGSFGSPTLAMALTAGEIWDRILGASEGRRVPLTSVFTATGNNIQFKGDLGRRVVPIDLDPKVEHPEDRTGFRVANLIDHLKQERPRLVVAALTMLRAFILAGKPAHGRSEKGSYGAWDQLIRGAVIWAGGADPLGGVQRVRDASDEDKDRLRALLVAWNNQFGGCAMTIAAAVRAAGDSGDLHDAFASYCRAGKPEARQLGFVLRRVRGRVISDLTFHRDNVNRDGIALWTVSAPTTECGVCG